VYEAVAYLGFFFWGGGEEMTKVVDIKHHEFYQLPTNNMINGKK
jgi:hypothetical protein